MKNLLLVAFIGMTFFACKKENPPIDPTLTILKQGTFQDEVHATSGTVKLAEDEAGKLYLVFENFSTDSGPDLYFYLSADKTDTDFTEVSSNVGSGDFQVALPAGTDTAAQTYVLVWCKQFSVLFGSAKLE
jgi:hypothetical protein